MFRPRKWFGHAHSDAQQTHDWAQQDLASDVFQIWKNPESAVSAFHPLLPLGGDALSAAAIVFGIWKRPPLFCPPVSSPINHASKIIRRAIFRQMKDAHRDLVAYPAADDARNGPVADLKHPIRELDLTAAFTVNGVAL